LIRLAHDKTIREFALRALADRTDEPAEVPVGPFVAALSDPDSRVRRQAVAALGRLEKSATAADLNEATTQALRLAAHDPALRATTVELLSGRANLSDAAVEFLGAVAASASDAPALRARALRGLQRAGGVTQRAARGAAIAALAAVGASDNPPGDLQAAWQEFVRDNRHARDVQEFITLAEGRDAAPSTLAYAILVALEENGQASGTARPAIERAWSRPESAARLLRAVGAVRADRYSAQVQVYLKDADPIVRLAAAGAAHRQ